MISIKNSKLEFFENHLPLPKILFYLAMAQIPCSKMDWLGNETLFECGHLNSSK
jgi:hypothetical protein